MVLFQLFCIVLMLSQSFIYPMIIGAEAFGYGMLVLASVFLFHSMFEVVAQVTSNQMTRKVYSLYFGAVISAISVPFILFFCLSLNIGLNTLDLIGVSLFGFLLCFSTYLNAHYISIGQIRVVLFSLSFGVLAYISSMYFLDLGWRNILLSNVFCFLIIVVVDLFFLQKKNKESFQYVGSKFTIQKIISGGTLILPVILMSNGLVLALGYLEYPPTEIAAFRIFLSAINAGKFFNLIPVSVLQSRFSLNAKETRDFEVSRDILTHFSCIFIYSCLLSIFFPFLYSIFYGEHYFSLISLLLSGLYLAMQPLGYIYVVLMERANKPILFLPLICTIFFIVVVFLMSLFGFNVFTALSGFIVLFFCTYTLNLYKHLRNNLI